MNIPQVDEKKGKSIVIIAIVVTIVILVFIFGKNIADFIRGLFGGDDQQSASARQAVSGYDYSQNNPTSPFSTTLFQNAPDGTTLISDDLATTIAGKVNDSTGFFWWIGAGIDAGEAYSYIKQCPSQCDVSKVCSKFQSMYSTDMYDYMSKYFTSNSNVEIMKQIIDYVTALPVYNN